MGALIKFIPYPVIRPASPPGIAVIIFLEASSKAFSWMERWVPRRDFMEKWMTYASILRDDHTTDDAARRSERLMRTDLRGADGA